MEKNIDQKFQAFKSSFSFELKALEKIKAFSIAQDNLDIIKYNGTYIDPITNKIRQFDILYENNICLNRNLVNKANINLSIVYSLECKEVENDIYALSIEEKKINPLSSLFVFNNLNFFKNNNTNDKKPNNLVAKANIPKLDSDYNENVFIGQKIGIANNKNNKYEDNALYEKFLQCANVLGAHHQTYLNCEEHIIRFFIYIPIIVIPESKLKVVKYNSIGNEIGECNVNSIPIKIDFTFSNGLYLPHFEIVCIDHLQEKFTQTCSKFQNLSQTLIEYLNGHG